MPRVPQAIWIFSLIDYERPTYASYRYPEWAIGLGWFLASLSILPIPLCAAVTLWQAAGRTPWEVRHQPRPGPDPVIPLCAAVALWQAAGRTPWEVRYQPRPGPDPVIPLCAAVALWQAAGRTPWEVRHQPVPALIL